MKNSQTKPPTELALISSMPSWGQQQVALLQQQLSPGATIPELELYGSYCARTGLDPFARQIYLIIRGDEKRGNRKATIQCGIDGFRTVASRSGCYGGSETYYCGPDGEWVDVWISEHAPAACKTLVYRTGVERPFVGVAHWDDYVQSYYDRDKRTTVVADQWLKRGRVMLAKCSEALALRKAFPADLSGLYIREEVAEEEMAALPAPAPAAKPEPVKSAPAPTPAKPAPEKPAPAQAPAKPAPAPAAKPEPQAPAAPKKKAAVKLPTKEEHEAAIRFFEDKLTLGTLDAHLLSATIAHRLGHDISDPVPWENLDARILVRAATEANWMGLVEESAEVVALLSQLAADQEGDGDDSLFGEP